MNISPVSSSPITQYMRPLAPVKQIQKVQGGAAPKLLKAAKLIEMSEDSGRTYSKSLRENSEASKVGSHISIIV